MNIAILNKKLEKYNIPHLDDYIIKNNCDFIRWGKSNRYWMKKITEDIVVIGDWSVGMSKTLRMKDVKQTPKERRMTNKAIEIKREELEQRQQEASRQAAEKWISAPSIRKPNEYLDRKKIKVDSLPQDIKIIDNKMAVPLRDVYGKFKSIQYISPNGDKRFEARTTKKESFYVFGLLVDGKDICISEGFATAYSVYQITDLPSVMACDCNNLVDVGLKLRIKYPKSRIIICADNDAESNENTGLCAGRKLKDKIKNSLMLIPEIGSNPKQESVDFNDIFEWNKLSSTSNLVKLAIGKAELKPNKEAKIPFYPSKKHKGE